MDVKGTRKKALYSHYKFRNWYGNQKEWFTSLHYVPGLSEMVRQILFYTSLQVIFNSILMDPKDKIPLYLTQNVVYHLSCPEENCKQFCIDEHSRCIENRVKEQRSPATSAVCDHCESNNHPQAEVSYFRVIYQDSKQFVREARETIHSIAILIKCRPQKYFTVFRSK